MKTTILLSLAVVASTFSLSASAAAPDLHRVTLDRVARTEETERTSQQVRQALARYSQPSITEIVQQQQQQEQQQQQHGREKLTEEEKAFSLEQRLLRIPSRVLRRLRGQAPQVATQFQEQKLEQDQDQDGKQQQEQEPRKGAQSAFRAEVGGTKEKNAKDKNTDKEYDVYEDDDDDDDDDDELEDEDDKKGQKAGGADKKEKEKEVASVMQLAQFDSASSRRSKAIDSERVPIEYNPSEVAFVGQVGIGTPNQYFNLEFDIGSSDTWVTSARANCSQNSPCSTTARRGFHIERSSTFENAPNISWHLELSEGPVVKGKLGTDVVQVAGFVVDRQVIGVADSLKGVKENGIDGSFGLGLMDLTFNGDPTPVDNLINANAMRSEVGVWLGSGNQGGELTFGGQDRARYTGSLSYYQVPAGSAYWSTPIHSLTVVTDKSIEFKDKVPRNKRTIDQVDSRVGTGTGISVPNVIFDTSTNIILVPPRVAYRTHQLIHDYFFGWYSGYSYFSGLYTVSCDLSKIDLWFDLGPQAASPIPGSDTVVSSQDDASGTTTPLSTITNENTPQVSAQSSASFTKGNITTNGEWTSTNKFRVRGQDLVRERVPVIGGIFNLCFSGIQASKNDEDDWVFGNIWFMNNYMTLDHRRRLIGIAPAVQS
ncbi:acid protease [Linnemannia elongata AG-77]|uniref:Acid protease n=1 Tax=Linnemannia elongata AG-77 TaxID=1314771 RepID=A0A197JEG2_9FUNG|nr:acid protease [Linnemannia elongata AG-77]